MKIDEELRQRIAEHVDEAMQRAGGGRDWWDKIKYRAVDRIIAEVVPRGVSRGHE